MKHSGNYIKALTCTVGPCLAITLQVFAIIQLSQGLWGIKPSPLWFIVFIPSLLASCVILTVPRFFIGRERKLRKAYSGDDILMPRETPLFITGQPLTDGETITLVRTSTASNRFLGFYIFLLVVPFSAFCSAGLAGVFNLPDLYLSNEPIVAWVFLSLPFLTGGGLGLYLGWVLAGNQRYDILADDSGITVRQSFRTPIKSIPWADIHIFIRESRMPTDSIVGTYWLAGNSHLLSLDIAAPLQDIYSSNIYHYFQENNIKIDYETYLEKAKRILETAVSRGNATFRMPRR